MMTDCREGEYARERVPVLTNATDIPARLKALRESFFVMLNTKTQRFEIHDAAQRDGTLCCTLPFDALDARAIEYARRYRAERLAQTAREIDAFNEKLEREAEKDCLNRAADRTREAFSYLRGKTDRDAIPEEIMNA